MWKGWKVGGRVVEGLEFWRRGGLEGLECLGAGYGRQHAPRLDIRRGRGVENPAFQMFLLPLNRRTFQR